MGIFNLILLIIGIIVFLRISRRRVKRTFKPQPPTSNYVAPANSKTVSPQLLNQILLMLPGENNEILSHLTVLMADGKNTEIDLMMICPTGFYVFYSKNDEGIITGNVEEKMWQVMRPDGSILNFMNPIQKNKDAINALCMRYPALRKNWFSNYLVFSNQCNLSQIQNIDNDVVILSRKMLFERLRDHMLNGEAILNPETIKRYVSCFKPYTEGERSEIKQPPKPNLNYMAGIIHEIKPPDLSRFSSEDRALKNKLTLFSQEQSQIEATSKSAILDERIIESLINMKPITPLELQTINGFDDEKSEKYGEQVIGIIREHCNLVAK